MEGRWSVAKRVMNTVKCYSTHLGKGSTSCNFNHGRSLRSQIHGSSIHHCLPFWSSQSEVVLPAAPKGTQSSARMGGGVCDHPYSVDSSMIYLLDYQLNWDISL